MAAKHLSNFSGVNVGKQRGEQTRRQEKMTPEHKGAEREKRRHAEKGQLVPLDGEGGLSARLWSKSSLGCSLASCSLELASLPLCRVLQRLSVQWKCQ